MNDSHRVLNDQNLQHPIYWRIRMERRIIFEVNIMKYSMLCAMA